MILSIESSCDDSAIALTRVDNFELLFHKKITQTHSHAKFNGVVPELAARLHARDLPLLLKDALKSAKKSAKDIKAIAVTNEPGLTPSLLEGIMMAKALSISLSLPLISINHLVGHVFSLFLNEELRLPLSILLVSGGHTMILELTKQKEYFRVATTLDDSLGEAFDKAAIMLGEHYPGGPIIERLAAKALETKGIKIFNFKVPLTKSKNIKSLAFSFSGLKNLLRLKIAELTDQNPLSCEDKLSLALAFQNCALEHIEMQVNKYLTNSRINLFGVVGGVSANIALRNRLINLCNLHKKEIIFSPLEFCTDNAAMIGRVAIEKYKNNDFISLENLDCRARVNFNESKCYE